MKFGKGEDEADVRPRRDQAADAAPAAPEVIAPVANKAGLKAALLIAFIFVDLMLLLVNVPLAVFFGVVAFFVWRAKR